MAEEYRLNPFTGTLDLLDVTAAGHAQSHVLATTAGLGPDHTTSGLSIGQFLRATGATTAAFQAIQLADLPAGIDADTLDGNDSAFFQPANTYLTEIAGLGGRAAGDILYVSAVPQWALLTPNQTATNRFLRTVNGGLPAYAQVDFADLSGSLAHASLTGLGNDDHTQYLLVDGSRALSADWDAVFSIEADTFTASPAVGDAQCILTEPSLGSTGILQQLTNGNLQLINNRVSGSIFLAALDSGSVLRSLLFVPNGGFGPNDNIYHDLGSAGAAWRDVYGNRFRSVISTGTSPFVIASTTVSANLNADLLDGRNENEFFLLAGRAGGQTAVGGTASGNDLILRSNPSNNGLINCEDQLQAVSVSRAISSIFPALDLFPNGATLGGVFATALGLICGSTFEMTSNPSILGQTFFRYTPIYKTQNGVAITATAMDAFWSTPTFQADGAVLTLNSLGALPAVASYLSAPGFNAINGGTGTLVSLSDFVAQGGLAAGWTCTNWFSVLLEASAGGTVTNYAAINITSGAIATTTNISLRSINAGLEMRHRGPAVFGANAAPTNASVGLEVQSTTKAFMLPRMTTTQRNALTALNGMMIYNTTTGAMEAYESGAWV